MQAFIQYAKRLIMLVGLATVAAPVALAFVENPGKVLKCATTRIKDKQVCHVQAKNMRPGQKVTVYAPGTHFWVASGSLVKKSGQHGIVVFSGTKAVIHPGFLVQTNTLQEEAIDWSYAFSH